MDFDYIFRVLGSEYNVPLTEHSVTYFENFAKNFIHSGKIQEWISCIIFFIFTIFFIYFLNSSNKKYKIAKLNKEDTSDLKWDIVFNAIILGMEIFLLITNAIDLIRLYIEPELVVIEEFVKWCA